MDEWVKIPTDWILDSENGKIKQFNWKDSNKSNYIAALMLYMAIAHHVNRIPTNELKEVGFSKLSYTDLMMITGISKQKVSSGLKILINKALIVKSNHKNTNVYGIANYGTINKWAKLPAKYLYNRELTTIKAFNDFKLRQRNELNALKLYLLLVSLKDYRNNQANVSYTTICDYIGLSRNDIRPAIALLINAGWIDLLKNKENPAEGTTNNIYSIKGIKPLKSFTG